MSATGVRLSLSPPPCSKWSCWAHGKPSRLESGQVREIGFERSTRSGSSSCGELLERQQASLLNWSRWRESRAGSTPALSSERSRKDGLAGGKMAVMETSSDMVFPSRP